MSYLTRGTTWNASVDQAGTYTFNTASKYIDKNIALTIPKGAVAYKSGGGLTTDASVSTSNITLETTNNSGMRVVAIGEATRTATYATVTAGWVSANSSLLILGGGSSSTTSANKYIKSINLTSGKQFDLTSDVLDKMTIQYNATDSCVDFI